MLPNTGVRNVGYGWSLATAASTRPPRDHQSDQLPFANCCRAIQMPRSASSANTFMRFSSSTETSGLPEDVRVRSYRGRRLRGCGSHSKRRIPTIHRHRQKITLLPRRVPPRAGLAATAQLEAQLAHADLRQATTATVDYDPQVTLRPMIVTKRYGVAHALMAARVTLRGAVIACRMICRCSATKRG
jgi:hypothetical protein